MAPDTNKAKKKKKNENHVQRFGYTEEALSNALSDIRSNIRGIREACRQYGVPRSTIQDRLSGRVAENKRKVGPDPIFGFEGENKIVNWIIELAKCGIPTNKYDLLDTVAKLAKDLGIDHRFPGGKPGIRWYLSFLRRHPNISIREPEAINKAREAVKESTIRKWFADLHTFLVEKNALDILSDPKRILNADETGVSLSPKSGKVLAPKGYKNVYLVKKGNEKENITVLMVITASGEICPPLVVFPYLRPPRAVVDNMPSDWILGKSESGWMRADIFFEYISNGFNDWLMKNNIKRPVLFLVDGHKSHMSMPLSKFCEDNGIFLYALPPNTTHILQPADVSVFKPLKQEWKRTVKNWQGRAENCNKCITKTNFCQVFKETLNKEMSQTIKNGFRKCGLYPFDVEQVDFSKCVKDAQLRNAINAPTKPQRSFTERHFEIARQVFFLFQENIAKLGINPNLILRELDRAKDSYLLKRRSKSKTPRNSQSNSTTRHSKSLEVTGSKDSYNNSIQIPDIGSFISLNDISITPINDINLSEIYQVDNDIVFPIDTSIDDDNREKDIQINSVESNQDRSKINVIKIQTVSETLNDVPKNYKTQNEKYQDSVLDIHNANPVTNKSFDISLHNQQSGVTESEKENISPVIINQDIPLETNFDIDLSSAVSQSDLNSAMLQYNNVIAIAEDPDISLVKKLNTPLQEIPIPLSPTVSALVDNIEDPFKKHLKFPDVILKNKSSRTSSQYPSAIASKAWQQYHANKDKEKLDKENQIKKRKIEKDLKKKGPAQKKKKTDTVKKKVSETQSHIKCGACELDLISDTEEEGDKNIGCDQCIRWYHLKCTKLKNLSYNEAATTKYECELCGIAHNARKEVLNTFTD